MAVVEGGVHLAEHVGGEAVNAEKSLVRGAGSVVKLLLPLPNRPTGPTAG